MLKLYDYIRSSASYRVRIALAVKGVEYTQVPVHLLNNGGEQHSVEYLAVNPQGLVPCLLSEEGTFTQSMAIMEYLEERYPDPAILPESAEQRAYVRSIAQIIACDMHPLNNLRVLNFITDVLGHDKNVKMAWYHHWLRLGFNSLEILLNNQQLYGQCCFADQVTLADICLIPQIANAFRFRFPMDDYPTLMAINNHCLTLPAFKSAQGVAYDG